LTLITAKGEAQPTASGYFTSVLAKAAENGQEPATVCIEADKLCGFFSLLFLGLLRAEIAYLQY
jgi:hypothetical protein